MNKQISTLENVDIRNIWSNEASNFTPWLAENIDRLGDVIDMNLTVIEEEKPVEEKVWATTTMMMMMMMMMMMKTTVIDLLWMMM